jgi:recombinational DNA repair ATPase RecF
VILKTAVVQKFRSIENSGTVRFEPDVTCLVGKNESGKTAFLEALYQANPFATTATG